MLGDRVLGVGRWGWVGDGALGVGHWDGALRDRALKAEALTLGGWVTR